MTAITTESERRAARIAWLDGLGVLPSAYMGAIEPMHLLREARACFVAGQFMAAILAAAAYVEHTLAEELERRVAERPIDRMTRLAEAVADVSFRLVPITRVDAEDMTIRTKLSAMHMKCAQVCLTRGRMRRARCVTSSRATRR